VLLRTIADRTLTGSHPERHLAAVLLSTAVGRQETLNPKP